MRAFVACLLRSLAVTLTAVTFFSYIAIGHGMHPPNDGMAKMHGAGICLVLFVAAFGLAVAVFRIRPPQPALPFVSGISWPKALAPIAAPLGGARASPAWLQIFRR